jgi:CheY-like chemotaxis protein
MSATLLFADDEPGVRDLVRFMFAPMGYEVVTVENGEAAVEQVLLRHFDLVVLDLNMPRMTGADAIRRIHRIRPGQKLIVMSGSIGAWTPCSPDDAEGVLACLQKPLTIDELIAAVQSALDGSPIMP